METKTEVGKHPDFKGDGVAVWINEDKNGKKYLTIQIVNGIRVNALKNEPKPKDDFSL